MTAEAPGGCVDQFPDLRLRSIRFFEISLTLKIEGLSLLTLLESPGIFKYIQYRSVFFQGESTNDLLNAIF